MYVDVLKKVFGTSMSGKERKLTQKTIAELVVFNMDMLDFIVYY